MSTPIDAIRSHHRFILSRFDTLSTAVESDPGGRATLELEQLLVNELLGHARGEEQALYPAVEPLLTQSARSTATMSIDHEHIEHAVEAIRDTIRLIGCAPDKHQQFARRLHDQLIALRAILTLHIEKEERVYLPLIEQHLSLDEQQALFDKMHENNTQSENAPDDPLVLDVRRIPPAERHPLIFSTFDQLQPQHSIVLVNDHDPKPLYYQFYFERAGQFEWEYLESGPDTWRVKIVKRSQ
jgi:uncharacterized protein (DUF2249 family)